MRTTKLHKVSWLSVTRPDQEEFDDLKKQFPEIHPLVFEELLTPTIRPRVEHYGRHLYMVLHFPHVSQNEEQVIPHEIDFILTKDTLVTVQYDSSPLLDEFSHECEDPAIRDRYGETPIHLLYYMLRELFRQSLEELDRIQELIDELEDRIFNGGEKQIVRKTSLLKRTVLDFRRAIKPQHYTLKSLQERAIQFYDDPSIRPFLIDLVGEHLKVWNLLENHQETLDALFETNNALIADRTNHVITALTALALVMFPLQVLTGVFGMNTVYMPFVQHREGFWIILGIMGLCVLIMVTIFKRKKWL